VREKGEKLKREREREKKKAFSRRKKH